MRSAANSLWQVPVRLLVVAALLTPRLALADTVFTYEGSTTGVSGNLILPCIKVALVAQGDQRGDTTSTQGSFGPTLSASNGSGGGFTLKISVVDLNGQGIHLFPPGPCKDGTCQNVNMAGVTDDGTRLLFHFQISSPDGRVDPASVVGFNPQPEPPGDFAGNNAVIASFAIADAASATVSASLVVLNQSTGRIVTVQ